jgi:hypothetical protein
MHLISTSVSRSLTQSLPTHPRRPTGKSWEDRPSALVPVRSAWQEGNGRRAGGFQLLTLRKKILGTELLD